MKKELANKDSKFFDKIDKIIFQMKNRVATTVNTAMVYTYFEIGRYIVEDEQNGKQRAEYGKTVLKDISARLTEKYGNGWSVENLNLMRKFFMIYSVPANLVNSVYPIQASEKATELPTKTEIVNSVYEIQAKPEFTLSWSHYLILMRIENKDERAFYEIECKAQNWSVRELSRQVNSSLYERLALSRNKDEVMKLSQKGHTVEKPQDILRNQLTHQDLGQMQMYVNYFDRYVKQDSEAPTIGILLCKQKDDVLEELTLPKDSNIYAQKYELYLPDKKLLQQKLEEWLEEAEAK